MPLSIWNVSADTLVLVLGAGGAAVLAAVTAQWRLRAQLRHDSEVRERDATRAALDSVVDAINDATGPMNEAGQAFRELYPQRAARPMALRFGPLRREAEAAAADAVRRLREQRIPLMGASFRLHLRFPDTDPIIARLAEWRATYDQLADAYEAALNSPRSELATRYDAADDTARRLGHQLNEFLTQAREWGANPPD
jgi:hypothetical protein